MRSGRLIDAYRLSFNQDDVDFAIPHLDEDIPLYLDPFLLWSSREPDYQELHRQLEDFLATFAQLARTGRPGSAESLLLTAREPQELGLGYSEGSKRGSFLGAKTAGECATVFRDVPQLADGTMRHIEELGLLVPKIAEDRISDLTACVLREYLSRYTEAQATDLGVPTRRFRIPEIWDAESKRWRTGLQLNLPYHPDTESPLLFAPLALLRRLPWINYPDYRSYYARYVLPPRPGQKLPSKTTVLAFNRSNYQQVERYVEAKERAADQAAPDPLFQPLKLATVEKKVRQLARVAPGRSDAAEYEKLVGDVLKSSLYPELEFAAEQVRTVSGAHVRDLIFYNDAKTPFARDVREDYEARQIVFELKNVGQLEPEHVNQLYRYLGGDFGRLGVLVSRKPAPAAVRRNIVDLWSAKRVAVVCIDDEDLRLLIRVLEARRPGLDVVKKKYVEFTRLLPN